jgi:hypothetical protein
MAFFLQLDTLIFFLNFIHLNKQISIFITAIYSLDFIHRPCVLQPQRFRGWFFSCHQVKPTLLGAVDRASLYWWLQNIRTMDKVQIIDRSNTAPLSKTFTDEEYFYIYRIYIKFKSIYKVL